MTGGSISSIKNGFKANLPLALSVASYGSILGVLAVQKELSWLELLVMNLMVFAGSAQFVMVEMWLHPIPILEMVLAVGVINLRYLLIGASLHPLFKGKPLWQKASIMHLVADENWAITMGAWRNGSGNVRYLFGGGLCVMASWCFGTMLGHRLGSVVKNPETFALDYAFVAVFTGLTISLYRGKSDVFPWITAAVVAILTEMLVPGKWYILTGGFTGALTAAFTYGEKDD